MDIDVEVVVVVLVNYDNVKCVTWMAYRRNSRVKCGTVICERVNDNFKLMN